MPLPVTTNFSCSNTPFNSSSVCTHLHRGAPGTLPATHSALLQQYPPLTSSSICNPRIMVFSWCTCISPSLMRVDI